MERSQYVFNQIAAVTRNVVPAGGTAVLFGSRARGDAKRNSDWDVLIVLPKKLLVQDDYDRVSFPLVELGWQLDERINPILFTKEEWEANSITPFYDNVQRDSIPLVS